MKWRSEEQQKESAEKQMGLERRAAKMEEESAGKVRDLVGTHGNMREHVGMVERRNLVDGSTNSSKFGGGGNGY